MHVQIDIEKHQAEDHGYGIQRNKDTEKNDMSNRFLRHVTLQQGNYNAPFIFFFPSQEQPGACITSPGKQVSRTHAQEST